MPELKSHCERLDIALSNLLNKIAHEIRTSPELRIIDFHSRWESTLMDCTAAITDYEHARDSRETE